MPGQMPVASRMNDWEAMYQRGEVFWDRGAASPPLLQWSKSNLGSLRGRVLVIGCGHGHDVAALREIGVDAHGLDISPTALDGARQRYPQVPSSHWHCQDLFNLPESFVNSWDVIVEHTCLSGLPPELRPNYQEAVLSALKPGGLLVGVWFIKPDRDPSEPGPPYAFPVEQLDALFANVCSVLDDYIPTVAYPGREGRERVRVLQKQ
jgi:methyl halide transferase